MATTERAPAPTTRPHPVYSALVGLASLGVLLQGLWAGLFLRRGGDHSTWVAVHQHAGETTVLLGVLAAVAALIWMRHRRPALIGTLLFAVLLVVELVLGYTIDDGGAAVVVHVPLAMLLMGLAVYLPLTARR
jgi:hypothetical protein